MKGENSAFAPCQNEWEMQFRPKSKRARELYVGRHEKCAILRGMTRLPSLHVVKVLDDVSPNGFDFVSMRARVWAEPVLNGVGVYVYRCEDFWGR